MPYVNNELFLDLAKADFNMCQSIHQKELEELVRSELQPLRIHWATRLEDKAIWVVTV